MADPTVNIKFGVTGHQQVVNAFKQIGKATSAVVIGFSAVFAATKAAASSADELGKAAQKAGVAVDEFSALAGAAKQSNISTEQLTKTFKELNKTLVNNGGIFEQMGIERFDQGAFRSRLDILTDLADKFKEYGEGARTAELAERIFKKTGQDALPFLLQGGEAIKKQAAEMKELGAVIDQDLADASDEFGDNLDKIHLALKGLGYDLARETLPLLNQLTAWMVNFAKETRKAASDQNKGGFIGGLRDIFQTYKAGAKGVGIIARGLMGGEDSDEIMRQLGQLQDETYALFRGEAATDEALKKQNETRKTTLDYLNKEMALRYQIKQSEDRLTGSLTGKTIHFDDRKLQIDNLEARLSLVKELKAEMEKTKPDEGIVGEGDEPQYTVAGKEYYEKMQPILKDEIELREKIKDLKNEKSFTGQAFEQFKGFMSKMAELPQAFGAFVISPLQGLFDGLTESIDGLIKGTKSWSDALKEVGSTILNQVVAAFAKLLAQAIILFGVISLLNVIAPGLGSALGAMAGLSAGAGGGAAGAAGKVGVGQAGSFAEGGYTGRYGGVVHGDEYVMPPQAVRQYGLPFMEGIRTGRYAGEGNGAVNLVAHLPVMTSQAQLDDYATKHEIAKILWVNNTYRHKFA